MCAGRARIVDLLADGLCGRKFVKCARHPRTQDALGLRLAPNSSGVLSVRKRRGGGVEITKGGLYLATPRAYVI